VLLDIVLVRKKTMDRQKREQLGEFLHVANALLDSMNTSLRADSSNVWKYASYKQYIRKYNQLVNAISQVMSLNSVVDIYDLDKIPGSANTIAIHQKELYESVHANLSILKA
jgi:hypothetical protein